MRFDWLKARQTKYTAYLVLYLLVVLAILTAANWLANRYNKSFDLTENKQFSLSDQTEKVVRGLQTPVRISYYDRTSEFSRARDLLDRYDNLSPRLSVDYIDPDKKPQAAKAAGVRTYGTIFVEAAGRKEEAKGLSEEEITGALIRVLKGGERTACAVTGSGEHSLDDSSRSGYSEFKELLERNNYRTESISLLEKPEPPKHCTVLIVAGPRFDYVEPVVKAIKTYVESGGRALFLLDPPLRLGKDDVADNALLIKALEEWGIVLAKDLVLDTSGVGQLFGLGPEVPLVSSYESHPIVREMKSVATAFPIARSLEIKSVNKVSAETLFSSSENSYATTNLNSAAISINPARDKKGPLALAAAGVYHSGQDKGEGRFVVVGSSDWAANGFLRFNGNRDLVMNMMNWLSSDEDLISIRPKEPQDRRLTMSRGQMRVIFYTSVVLLPLLIVIAGVSVWWRRR